MEAAGLAFSVAQTALAALSYPPLQQMFTMWGYQSELENLKRTVSNVSSVLDDVQSVDEEKLSHLERNLIEQLKEAVYDADDLLDEFATLAKPKEANQNKVRRLFSRFKELKLAYSMSREVKDIRQKLDQIVGDAKFGFIKIDRQPIRKREETYAYVKENRIIGRDIDKERIVNMLLDPNIQGDASVLAIVGIGGLGKTALAQLVYNDDRIQKEFPLRCWVCVSDQDQKHFNIMAILAKICKVATDDLDMDSLVQRLRDKLNRNKYLLVLDDVWTEDRIECEKLLDILIGSGQVAKRGNRIVITTRSKKTATAMRCKEFYELQGLSDEDSWLLFKITSGMEQENCHDLVKMGEDIVKKCANVPLAIKVVGSFLYGQNEDTWRCIQQHGLSATSKDENKIMLILKFSYNHLSLALKSCFIYCAMFPKDSELPKESIISMWIAHDCVKDEGQGIEVAAEYYFNILVQRCFFQDIHEVDHNDGGTITFKIHDLMHDMAHQIAGKEIFIAGSTTSNLDENIHHLCDVAPRKRIKDFMAKSKIRSYIKYDTETLDNISFPVSMLLKNWRSLRVLALSDLGMSFLPNAIGELLHLRWLCLHDNTELKKLPKSLTKLINLKTLCVQGCSKLEELPGDFSKLINLRTLSVPYEKDGGLRCMPLGMENMACLTRLNKFILGERKSSTKRKVRLEDLRVPRNLRGTLDIYISPNYKHCKEYGGGGGYLCNTENLKSISVKWSKEYKEERMDSDDDDVLEALQPHSNLKELEIKHYLGLTIPSWAREDGLATSLPNLVKIVLVDCERLMELPWLGKLQHLKILRVGSLTNLEYMENKTRGTNISSSSSSGGAASSSMVAEIFFPFLENLELFNLPKLKGAWREPSGSGMRDGVIKGGQRLTLFPRLSHVEIANCPNLRSIPLGPAVETLILVDSGIMEEVEDQKVVGGIRSNGFGNSGGDDPKIKEIKTDNMRFLNFLPIAFQGLTKMAIYWDGKVECLSEVEEVLRRCSSSLQFLKFIKCMNLRSVSRGLQHLAALESLELAHLPELRFDETQGEREGEDEDDNRGDDGTPWRCLTQCLRSLELCNLPKVVELPKGMRYLTALQSLKIVDLPLKDLPEWVECLRSLHALEIILCKNLESLPEALQRLTSLRRLELKSCAKILYERCEEPNGKYWPIIQHINDIIF